MSRSPAGRTSASRSRAVLAAVALALLVAAGCTVVDRWEGRTAAGDGEAEGGPERYAGSPADRSEAPRTDGGRDSEPDLGEGRLRDPLPEPRRGDVTDREWREVFVDEFDGLDTDVWTPYSGVPGCCPAATWDPSMVRVEDSVLHLDTARVGDRWLSGGVGSWDSPLERQYGRWDMRVRTDGDALGVTVAALLWPADDVWPPEIDFYEIFETRPDRDEMTITNHYGEIGADGSHDATRRPVSGDFTRWHVMSVRWTADEIQVLMDGEAVETIRAPGQIPDKPMWLALQTAVKRIGADEPAFDGRRAMEVDWVRVYEPA